MNKVSLSKFQVEDAGFVKNNFASFFKNPTLDEVEKRIELWQDNLGFCINFGNNRVGLITLSEKQDKKLSFGIEILKEFRGKGIATHAFNLAAAEAKKRGYSTIISSCGKTNIASKNLHKKLGFALIKTEINAAGKEMCRWEKKI